MESLLGSLTVTRASKPAQTPEAATPHHLRPTEIGRHVFPQLPRASPSLTRQLAVPHHSPLSIGKNKKTNPEKSWKKSSRRANPRLPWRRRNPNSPRWIGPGKGLLPQIGAPTPPDSIRQLNLAPIRGWIFSPPAASPAPLSLDPSAKH